VLLLLLLLLLMLLMLCPAAAATSWRWSGACWCRKRCCGRTGQQLCLTGQLGWSMQPLACHQLPLQLLLQLLLVLLSGTATHTRCFAAPASSECPVTQLLVCCNLQ
jgi:hypothetical protein